MKLNVVFPRIGLSPLATKVYEALEKSEPLLVTDISVATGLHRPTVYRELAALKKAKLIRTVPCGKRTAYQAEDRARILALFKEATEQTKATLEESPHIEGSSQLTAKHLSGASGIRATFDDAVNHSHRGDVFYRYTSERSVDDVNAYLAPDYRARRDRKRLERLVISNAPSGSTKRPRLERFIKFMPSAAGVFDQNVIQLIYGNRVAVIDLSHEETLIIENQAYADFQKTIFRHLYRTL